MIPVGFLTGFIGDEVEAEFALRRFDAAVAVALRDFEIAQLHFRRDERPGRYVPQSLVQNLDALAHLQHADVIPVVHIADVADRHAEVEPAIQTILVHLAHVVLHAAGAGHRAGNAGVDGELLWQDADLLAPSEQDFVVRKQLLEFVEETRKSRGNVLCLLNHRVSEIHADAAEAHVIAHHSRAADGFKQVENPLSFTKRVQ